MGQYRGIKKPSEACDSDLLFEIYGLLAFTKDKESIDKVFEAVGQRYSLSRGLILEADSDSLFLSVDYEWNRQKGRKEIDSTYCFEYDEWDGMNPMTSEDATLIVGNVDELEGSSDMGFCDVIGAKSLLAFALTDGEFFYGSVIFVGDTAREWKKNEIETLRETARLLFSVILDSIESKKQRSVVLDSVAAMEEANLIKKDFLTNLSHEFRTPLNSILGFIYVLNQSRNDQATFSQCLKQLEESSKQLLDLVNDCLDVNRISSGGSQSDSNWFGLEDVIGSVVENYRGTLEKRSQRVITQIAVNHKVVKGEADKLIRVLSCVVDNASKYSHVEDEIDICVKEKPVSSLQSMFIFHVLDNGIGIDDSFINRVFEPFSQGGSVGCGLRTQGTGLGLTIARNLVELMHGTIDIYSTKGKGTEVIIEIPLIVHDQNENPADSDFSGEQMETLNDRQSMVYIGNRVLIVEDNLINAEAVAAILGQRGFETEIADNGEVAVSMFRDNGEFYYDLVLMDILMPVMDGIEATKRIREMGKADSRMVPIVALSANALYEDRAKSIAAGMNAHISKPVDVKELFEVIEQLVI